MPADLLETPATDIVLAVEATPQIVLLDAAKFDQFYERVKAEADKVDGDVSTKKGREAIKSMAFKIAETKSAIEKARLDLTRQWREQTDAVNSAGKEIKQRLETLQKDVRRPVTEWEDAEKARVEWCQTVIADLKRGAVVTMDDTSETVRTRGSAAYGVIIKEETFGDMFAEAQAAREATVETLKAALARLLKEEADRIELERLRALQAEREAEEAEKVAAELAINQRRQYARDVIEHINQCELGMIGGKSYPYVILIRELEEKIETGEAVFGDMAGDVEKTRVETLARVKAAQEQQAQRDREEAAREAADQARREAEEAAQRQRGEEAAAAKAEIDAANARARKAEEEAQAERDRIAQQQAEREAEEKRLAEQKAAEEADRALQRRRKTEAKQALMACGVSEDAAQKIVLAVRAGEIPHIGWTS